MCCRIDNNLKSHYTEYARHPGSSEKSIYNINTYTVLTRYYGQIIAFVIYIERPFRSCSIKDTKFRAKKKAARFQFISSFGDIVDSFITFEACKLPKLSNLLLTNRIYNSYSQKLENSWIN